MLLNACSCASGGCNCCITDLVNGGYDDCSSVASQLWKLRNNERHGVTPVEKSAALRITAERELAALYDRRAFCEHRHQNLFYETICEHRRQSLREIRNWISMQSSIIRISCQRHLEAQIAGT
jgi:hypothetical protein